MHLLRKLATLVVAVVVLSMTPSAAAQTVQADVTLPGVQLDDVTVLGPSAAVVSANIDPNGLATDVYVEYGTTTALGQTTPLIQLGAGLDPTKIVAELLDLAPGATYFYRVVAASPAGTSVAPTAQFQTPPASVNPATGALGASGGGSAKCTVAGTSRADRLRGTSRRDVICGLGGNDRISGLGGGDVVYGGAGRDRITGGNGNDRLFGNAGADRMNGNAGRDRLSGGAGADRLTGGSGRDAMSGAAGRDRLAGTDRRKGDRINGGPGRDTATVNRGDRARKVERVRMRR